MHVRKGRGSARSGSSFRKQLLRNANRVGGRQPQIVRYSPEPHASSDVRIRLNRRQLNFALAGDADVCRRGIFRARDLDSQILERGGQLLERGWCGKFRVGGESIAVEHRCLNQLNRRHGRAPCEILGDISGDCGSGGFEAGFAFVAVLRKKVESYLRVENRLLDGAEGKQVCGLRFELVDSGLIAFRDGRKKRGGDCSGRELCDSRCQRAGNHNRGGGRRICELVRRTVCSWPGLGWNQGSERRYPGCSFPTRRENAREIDDGGACGLGCLPVSLGGGGDSGEECEAHFFKTIRCELADKGRLAGGFREGSGHYADVEQNNFIGREIALFEDELQLLTSKRGRADNRYAVGIRKARRHGSRSSRSRTVTREANHLKHDAVKSIGGGNSQQRGAGQKDNRSDESSPEDDGKRRLPLGPLDIFEAVMPQRARHQDSEGGDQRQPEQGDARIVDRVAKRVYNGRDHAGGGGSGHPDEVAIPAGCHSFDVETREAPGATADEEESDEPAKFGEVQRRRRICGSHGADSPGVAENGRSDTEADDVGERIKFFSEVAVGAHRARDASIERVEEDGETDGAGGVVEVGHFTIECGENGIVTAQKIGDGENTGEDVDAAAEAVFAKRISRPFFVADRI